MLNPANFKLHFRLSLFQIYMPKQSTNITIQGIGLLCMYLFIWFLINIVNTTWFVTTEKIIWWVFPWYFPIFPIFKKIRKAVITSTLQYLPPSIYWPILITVMFFPPMLLAKKTVARKLSKLCASSDQLNNHTSKVDR